MATFSVCAVRDRAVNAYMRPMFTPTAGAALRAFQDEVNRQHDDNLMYRHPDDYELFELGSFDDEHARFYLLDDPRLVGSAKHLKIS